jgi:hypothetical protein
VRHRDGVAVDGVVEVFSVVIGDEVRDDLVAVVVVGGGGGVVGFRSTLQDARAQDGKTLTANAPVNVPINPGLGRTALREPLV